MQEDTTKGGEVVSLREHVRQLLHQRIAQAVEVMLEEELEDALGCTRHERTPERRGYRHGVERRRVTTGSGPLDLKVPRARVKEENGTAKEFRSRILPRYARRAQEVDEAILGCYLAGANSRRIRKALAPLLGEENLSKSAVSRVVGRLKKLFWSWSGRDLSEESYAILYLDGFPLKVRMARRVVSVPVLAVLGVTADGRKVLVALRLAVSEAQACWGGLIEDLKRQGLPSPELLVSDGHKGLRKALEAWPEARVQRCTVHKRENLFKHCPAHARAEVKRDYDAIIYAEDGLAARKAYDNFVAKWSRLCPGVARSLEEGGLLLLTFYEFPRSTWKSLRSTNMVENLNREFRRRTKTQASFTNEEAAVTLLYGLVAFGQITMRRIDGHHDLTRWLAKQRTAVA